MDLRQTLTDIVHFLAGLITAHEAQHNPLLTIILYFTFIIYELDEDWHISDQAYHDILEYALALYTYTTISILLRLI